MVASAPDHLTPQPDLDVPAARAAEVHFRTALALGATERDEWDEAVELFRMAPSRLAAAPCRERSRARRRRADRRAADRRRGTGSGERRHAVRGAAAPSRSARQLMRLRAGSRASPVDLCRSVLSGGLPVFRLRRRPLRPADGRHLGADPCRSTATSTRRGASSSTRAWRTGAGTCSSSGVLRCDAMVRAACRSTPSRCVGVG
jgi:hypothetical protein